MALDSNQLEASSSTFLPLKMAGMSSVLDSAGTADWTTSV
jgi:hypothetical protein